jgi:DNA-binding MarR family transcriptional regulator
MAKVTENSPHGGSYVVSPDGLAEWSDTHRDAWIGLLEAHKQLTRALEGELEAEHGLSLSATEVLGRLASAEDRSMRMTALAEAAGLSLSRTSRICDTLEARGLVARHSCPDDARAVGARLTDEGLDLVRNARASHFASVQERFFDQLSQDEIETLAGIFQRFAPGSAACAAFE